VASVAPTPNAASAFANASLILLSFISGIFGFGDLPEWMDRVASVFPLKPFVEAFSDGFNPYIEASTPDWGALAVMMVWGIAAAVIVSRSFSWEPRSGKMVMRGRRRGAVEEEADETQLEVERARRGAPGRAGAGAPTAGGGGDATVADRITDTGPPGVLAIVGQQTRYAMTQLRRDPMSLFFSVIFPVLLVTFFSSVYGEEATWGGLPLPQYLAAAFSVYGVATSGLVNVPGSIAEHRTQRTLKRLRGTPMPPWSYIIGRILAVVVFGLLTVVLVFAVAVAFFSVTLPPSTWMATVLVFTLTICCFAACGLALVAVVDSPQAVIAMGLSILLPLSFISDIFIQIDQMPTVLSAIGWFFPLRHAVHAAVTATSGGALDAQFWVNLGVIALWMAATALAAWRFFRWEPRQARSSR
jgi:ABC-2 type transport system permease protein